MDSRNSTTRPIASGRRPARQYVAALGTQARARSDDAVRDAYRGRPAGRPEVLCQHRTGLPRHRLDPKHSRATRPAPPPPADGHLRVSPPRRASPAPPQPPHRRAASRFEPFSRSCVSTAIGTTSTPLRVDRTRERQRVIGDLLEAERPVIGRVADKDDALRALPLRRLDRDPDQFAADAQVLVRRPHGERAEQVPVDDARHAPASSAPRRSSRHRRRR